MALATVASVSRGATGLSLQQMGNPRSDKLHLTTATSGDSASGSACARLAGILDPVWRFDA